MIDDLPAAPDPASDIPSVFSAKAAAMVLAQKSMVPQINAAIAGFNSSLSGGAYALAYSFDSATADADPGAGKLRLSSATQNASTVLRLDTLLGGQDYTSVIDTFDASTSSVKGSIRLVKQGDVTKWLTFDVTARAAPTGYRNITVTNTGGSSASPFTTGDGLMLFFQRNGDKGTAGTAAPAVPGGTELLAQYLVSTAVANIDFLSVFASTYDKYIVEVQGLTASAADLFAIRMAKAGAVDLTTVYSQMVGDAVASTVNNSSYLAPNNNSASTNTVTLTLEFRNMNSATTAKTIGARGMTYINTTGNWTGVAKEGVYGAANAATGFRLYCLSGATFTAGTVRVYGVKNT